MVANYHDWRLACTTAAKQCLPTNGPLGGLGLLLPPSEFETLSGERYVLAAKPATVTNASTTHQQVVYDREQVALGALQAAVFASIPLATQQACPGYNAMYGTSFVALPTMMSHVHAKFGDASVNAYNLAMATLQQSYISGTDIDTFLATQVAAHLACARSGNPLNDILKVNSLITAVGGRDGPFGFTLQKFEEDTSLIAHRTFEDFPGAPAVPAVDAIPAVAPIGYAEQEDFVPGRPAIPPVPGRAAEEPRTGLASRIRNAAPRVLDIPAAPTSKGYYGAAEVVTSLKDTIKEALADAVTAANAASRRDRLPPRRDLYCWSHGLGGHSGSQCKNPRTGHHTGATSTKRLGGSNRGCQK